MCVRSFTEDTPILRDVITSLPAPGSEPRIAGTSMVSAREFIAKRLPAGAFEAAIAKLSPDDRRELSEIISPLHWYRLDTYLRFIDQVAETAKMPDLWPQMGTFAAELEINTFYKFILRFATPAWFLERGTRMWGRYHNTGTWKLEGGPRFVKGSLHDFGIPHAGMCSASGAWFLYAAKLTGAPKAVITHSQCRTKGAEACVYFLEW
jgi:hypothetical protein